MGKNHKWIRLDTRGSKWPHERQSKSYKCEVKRAGFGGRKFHGYGGAGEADTVAAGYVYRVPGGDVGGGVAADFLEALWLSRCSELLDRTGSGCLLVGGWVEGFPVYGMVLEKRLDSLDRPV